jgi:hypothetical protein
VHAIGGRSAPARPQYAGGHDLLAEQPPDDVDLVHRGVRDAHLGRETVRRRRGVAVRAVHEQRSADAAVVKRGLERAVPGVVPAHEAHLDQPPSDCQLGVDDPQAGFLGRGERLLAEHRLACADRREDLFLVRLAPGRDEHRVNVAGRDQVLGGRVDDRAWQAGGHLFRAGRVDVADRGHHAAAQHPGDTAHVVLADHAHADHADPHGHRCSSPIPRPRR